MGKLNRLVLIMVFFGALIYLNYDDFDISSITGNVISELEITTEDEGSIEVHFCPKEDCSQIMEDYLNQAEHSIHCALFDLRLQNLIELFKHKQALGIDVKLIVDNNNKEEENTLNFIRFDTESQLSHNKFCIIDDQYLTTGSMNPTQNGAYKNNNNLLLIESNKLIANYKEEFDELWNGQFGKGDKVRYKTIIINNTRVTNLFCPEDNCKEETMKQLAKAQSSIHFMTFSFTDGDIGNLIKSKAKDIEVKGVFEKTQAGSQYSQYKTLSHVAIKDTNPRSMHHKVFIIDNTTVITGSYNPTKSGDTKNDENMLIIENRKIAKQFLDEFNSLTD